MSLKQLYPLHKREQSKDQIKPLTTDEYKQIEISLSILTPAVPLPFDGEEDLME